MRIGRFVVCFHGAAHDDDSQHEEASIISILASKAVSVVYEKFPMFGLDVSISVGEILPNLASYLLYGCNISFCSSFCSDIEFSLLSVFDCCFPGPSQGL